MHVAQQPSCTRLIDCFESNSKFASPPLMLHSGHRYIDTMLRRVSQNDGSTNSSNSRPTTPETVASFSGSPGPPDDCHTKLRGTASISK